MNYRVQISPISSTCESEIAVPVRERRCAPPAENTKYFRSWLVFDSDLEITRTRRRVNWAMVLGLALATAISASFWAGVGLIMARLCK